MSLIKWNPMHDLDTMFDDQPSTPFSRISFDLAADVYEEDNTVVAKLSIPGIDPDEITITIEDDVLAISGDRSEEAETETKDYYAKEIRRGAFSRMIRLPRAVDGTRATATLKKGMLTITAPAIPDTESNAVRVSITNEAES